MDIFKSTGKKIKEYRELKGISQRELARRLNYSNGYISALERGIKTANIKILNEIATALDVDISNFFEEEHKTKFEDEKWVIFGEDLEKEGVTLDKVKEWVKMARAFENRE